MPGIRVVTDSACDLPNDLLAEFGIGLVPLRIRFGQEELVDRTELSTKEFWSRCRRFDGIPETSAPSPGQFQTAFEAMRAEGADGVVCVNLSSRLSATIEAARQGAKAAEGSLPVRVVDSLSVTLGEGLVTMEAAERAMDGGNLDEVAAAAEGAARRLSVYGAIDTLEYLRRGGRIGGAQALVGSLLSIKPVIRVLDGVVEEESKQRTRGRALRYLASKLRDAGPLDRVAACGADAPDMDEFLNLIQGVPSEEKMMVGEIGPVIGTHTGPGTVGVAWLHRPTT